MPQFFILIFALFLTAFAFGKDIKLSMSTLSPTKYDAILKTIEPGDKLIFDNGEEKIVGKKLGAGNTTVIFELQNKPEAVLRLPLHLGDFVGFFGNRRPYIEFLNAFIDGNEILEQGFIPKVKMLGFLKGNFIEVERIVANNSELITFGDFIRNYRKYSESERTIYSNAILIFAHQISTFKRIGDFHAEQVVFDEREQSWRLIDWTAGSEMKNPWEEKQNFTVSEKLSDFIESTLQAPETKVSSEDRVALTRLSREIMKMDAGAFNKWAQIMKEQFGEKSSDKKTDLRGADSTKFNGQPLKSQCLGQALHVEMQ